MDSYIINYLVMLHQVPLSNSYSEVATGDDSSLNCHSGGQEAKANALCTGCSPSPIPSDLGISVPVRTCHEILRCIRTIKKWVVRNLKPGPSTIQGFHQVGQESQHLHLLHIKFLGNSTQHSM